MRRLTMVVSTERKTNMLFKLFAVFALLGTGAEVSQILDIYNHPESTPLAEQLTRIEKKLNDLEYRLQEKETPKPWQH
jgi:hypothetical protein